MILIYLIVQVYGAIITYDTNLFTGFDYKVDAAFVCASASFTKSVTFSGTFANIPKVILTFDRFDLSSSTNFELSITSTTTTGFTLYINCPSANRAYRLLIRWYAIDDSHVEVINSFNIASPTLTKTFSHTNTNAVYGFLSITSMKFTGAVNFKLSISSLTSSSITTTLTSNTNLGQIGYQIILGINGAIENLGAQTSTSNYTSSALNIKQNSWIFTSYSGFNYPNVDGIRLVVTYTTTSTQTNYTLGNWDVTYAGNTHTPVWFPYYYIVVANAFKIDNLHIRTYEDFEVTTHQNMEISIQQLSQTYSANGVYKLNVDSSTQVLNINLYLKCQTGKKMSSQFNYCGQCLDHKPYQQNRYCPGTVNALKYFSRLKSTISAVKELTITITSSSLLITQLVYTDSSAIQLNLVSIQFQNA